MVTLKINKLGQDCVGLIGKFTVYKFDRVMQYGCGGIYSIRAIALVTHDLLPFGPFCGIYALL